MWNCLIVLTVLNTVRAFSPSSFIKEQINNSKLLHVSKDLNADGSGLQMMFGSGGGKTSIPSSSFARDNQAIDAIKAALNPSTKASSLIECEFPVLEQLNKLGDGSLRSAKDAEQSNLAFTSKLIKGLKPFPFIGPPVCLVTSSGASKSFSASVSKIAGSLGVSYVPLRDGIPSKIASNEVFIFLNPSSSLDYIAAQNVAKKATSIILNGFAKV